MPAQTPRKQLERLARDVIDSRTWNAPALVAVALVDAILATGWKPPARRIADTDGLDALPARTVIVDDWDTVWRRGEVSWFACDRHPDAPARIVLPAIVLHTP